MRQGAVGGEEGSNKAGTLQGMYRRRAYSPLLYRTALPTLSCVFCLFQPLPLYSLVYYTYILLYYSSILSVALSIYKQLVLKLNVFTLSANSVWWTIHPDSR